MDLDLLLLGGLYLFSAFIACAFFYQRLRWRRRRRLGKHHLGFYPTAVFMGNALHHLEAIAQPQVKYVIEEKLDEEADDDDAASPADPTKHLLRQASRIRKGEKLDHLTALIEKQN